MRLLLPVMTLLASSLLSSCSTPQLACQYPDRPKFSIGATDPLDVMNTALAPIGSTTTPPANAAPTGVNSKSATNSLTTKER